MTSLPSGNIDQASNMPTPERPSRVQGDFDIQGCPPIEVFREPDLLPRAAISNSRTSSKANGKGSGKGSSGKRIVASGRNGGSTSRKKKPKKSPRKKTILKRISSK
jgi:hypothetical protein